MNEVIYYFEDIAADSEKGSRSPFRKGYPYN